MKILLVYCNSMLENALPISISQLVGVLKASSLEVDLFDTTFYRWAAKSDAENRVEALQIKPFPLDQFLDGRDVYNDFAEKIEKSKPDLIGLSVVEPLFLFGMKLLNSADNIIRKNGIKVVVGGMHAIFAPETVAQYDLIDFISIGEAENSLPELCQRLDLGKDVSDLRGFWVKKNGGWIKNQKHELTDINELPPLDFSLFSESYLKKPMMGKMYKTVTIETTRGCPYHCTYCGDHGLRVLFKDQGPWYREKKIDKVIEELESYISTYQAEFVYIISESFLVGKAKRLREFCEGYSKVALPFWFNTRPEDITEEKIKLVKDANGKRVSIGLENGNEQFRKDVLKRRGTNENALKAAKILHDYKLSFSVNVIIGCPDETREMVFDSIEMCRQMNPDSISTHIYNPYHGTEMRRTCVEKGYIDSNLIAEDFFQADYVLKGNTLSCDDIMGLFRTIPLYVTLPKSEYKRIQRAERFDEKGNLLFQELKKEYYQLKGW
ncbi:MAG: B12-binding domain-containing radical SAM protein [Candidatus Brocadiales bacterium]|nr:B12-binding domain-containing radical SAM protein [Candidatus Brocadiales bacterium]